MTRKYMRGAVTALGLAAGLTLAACADERPYPVYNHGVAYYPAPSTGTTTYIVPSTGTTYYSPSTGMTYYTPSTVTTYSAPPCTNCDGNGAGWYRYHDGQWHVD
jgi:hypothetical protein